MNRIVGIALVSIFALGSPLLAQSAGGLQRNLDKPVDLSVSDLPIGEVFAQLTKDTGVKFVIDDDTLACLPYGGQTRLRVTLKNITLRNALTPMLAPQALQWSVEGDAVHISPSEALYRMCRRATYDELQVLGRIHSAKIQAPTPDETSPADAILAQLRTATDNRDLMLVFQVSGNNKDAAFARAAKSLPCTGAQWLDALCSGSDWTWYLWGDEIIVLDRKKQVERQLAKPVSLNYKNEDLSTVLMDLARQARVQLTMDPGVMQLLPAETRNNFNLVMADATIAQALEVISGATALTFVRTNEGITVQPSAKLTDAASATGVARKPASFFLRVKLPANIAGNDVELMIRSDDLPDDVRAAVEAQKAKVFDELRKQLVKAPTSKPADNSEPSYEGAPAKN